jgi:hypothetical protein
VWVWDGKVRANDENVIIRQTNRGKNEANETTTQMSAQGQIFPLHDGEMQGCLVRMMGQF